MVDFINGLDGTLATILICALLIVDEAGVPLPLAPNEVLLLIAGLLIGTGAISPWVFLPLAFLAMSGGMMAGFVWARALGDHRLADLARRLHADRTYERATARLRAATPVGIGVTRMIPGVRTYATLVAGAARVETRRFLGGALPALAVWLLLLTTVGAIIGLPAERLLNTVDGYLLSGGLLLVLGVGSVIALRHIPREERGEGSLSRIPALLRLAFSVGVDLGIVATLIAALERFSARVVHPGHPLGRVNDSIVVTALVVIGYVILSRRGTGATFGERLFDVDYRAVLARMGRGRRERAAATVTAAGLPRTRVAETAPHGQAPLHNSADPTPLRRHHVPLRAPATERDPRRPAVLTAPQPGDAGDATTRSPEE